MSVEEQAWSVLEIYRDEMRRHVAQALAREYGADWVHSQLLNADAGGRDSRWTERLRQEYESGVSAQNLLDVAEFPYLIQRNRDAFPDLDAADIQRMQKILQVRNEVAHSRHSTYTRDLEAFVEQCALVLEHCGLSAAADEVRRLAHAEGDHG